MNIKSKTGRNEPCPCGSGKKFKRCCLAKDIANSRAKKSEMAESKSKDDQRNPLGMYQLEDGGPWVLPETPCSQRRVEFLQRGNAILGFYTVITITSKQGNDAIVEGEQKGVFKYDTPFRLKSSDVVRSQMNYGLFRKLFAKAGTQLTNQVFLMLYGNFEAFLTDLIVDALSLQNTDGDLEEEALRLMILSKWHRKIDRINERLQLGLGKRKFVDWFKDIDMGFLGDPCEDPIDFLERMADLRHRLVHSNGRADAALIAAYPNAGLAVGQLITLPFDLPYELQIWFDHLTDLIDEVFAQKFEWSRNFVAPEKLTN